MAKRKDEGDVIAAPTPIPKVGDTVEYVWPAEHPNVALAGKTRPAKVTAVREGFDGRLLDLNVDTGNGVLAVGRAPWRDDGAGNTWDWPAKS